MKIQSTAFRRCEIILHSTKEYENPFADVQIDATFVCGDKKITLPGFWNGGNEWKVRFSSETEGNWEYTVVCSDKDNASLSDTGVIEVLPLKEKVTDLEKHGYPVLREGMPYFEYADGTPFFYLGDTHWQMPDYEHLHDCNYPGCNCGSQFMHVLKDRKKKGFNVYQTYFSTARTGTSHSGTHGWWLEPYKKINPEAFNESMDIMMEHLVENGFTVSLGFGCHCADPGMFGGRAEPMLAFARYCIARYACYPIIWIIGQEITNLKHNAFEIWQQVGALVKELDGYHHPIGGHMHAHGMDDPRSIQLNKNPWHQWWTVQGGHGNMDFTVPRQYYAGYKNSLPHKLILETECQYEDLSGQNGYNATRRAAYNAIIHGSAGYTYGAVGVWAMRWSQELPGFGSYNPESWFTGVDKQGSTEMTYMKKFFEYIKWWKFEPVYTNGYGEFEMRKYVAISRNGQDAFIFYFMTQYDEDGNLSGLKPNCKYQARWYDTCTGKFIDLPDIVADEKGKSYIPKKPSHRDWLLLLNNYDMGEYETENYPEYVVPVAPSEIKHGDKIEIKKLTASSCDKDHPVENMLDGSTETCWKPIVRHASQSIIADLGSVQPVGYLYLESHMTYMRRFSFKVFGSVDGENYDLLSDYPDNQITLGGEYNGYFNKIFGNYRYVKFFLESYPEQTPFELTHFEIYKAGDEQ